MNGPITFEILFTTVIVLFLMIAMYKDWFRPVLVFVMAVSLLLIAGIIDTKDALAGFANEQIGVIFLLLVLSDIIKKSGILDAAISKLFRPSLSYKGLMARLLANVSLLSAWVNNTPLVAILMPYLYEWSKKKGISPSKVLIPLSYAAILGGTITLIGTSTNLVVNGLAAEAGKNNADISALGIFDFTLVGLAVSVTGFLYLYFGANRLLPDRKDPMQSFQEMKREFLVETMVPEKSKYVGKTIDEAGLRNLKSIFLVEVHRAGVVFSPVSPNEIIQKNDTLVFAGATSTILELIKDHNGLALPEYSFVPTNGRSQVIEVVISANSSLINKKVRSSGFRANYDAAIIAINRDGERISGGLGEVELRLGDVLLLITGKDFNALHQSAQDFHVISRIKDFSGIQPVKAMVLTFGTIGAIVLSAVTGIALFKCLLVVVCIVGLMKVVRFSEIRKGIDIDLFVVLALALALGKAIDKSGVDDLFANLILKTIEPFNSPIAALAGIYIITNVLGMLVNNRAAVAIAFPIAIALVEKLKFTLYPDLSFTPFILAIAYAGSAEFVTPFGYQTNLMVYGPGGYKFRDYVKIGIPLTIIFMITALTLLGFLYNMF